MGRKSRLRTDNNREFAHGRGDGRCGTGAAAAVATLDQSSDDSLDEQLLDYLQNINKVTET